MVLARYNWNRPYSCHLVVWIFITPLPVYFVLANQGQQRSLIWTDYIGIIIFLFGFAVESIADYQKQVFKKTNPRDFISTGTFLYILIKQIGIYVYSRYPNYFGEVTLWYGLFILSIGGFVQDWQWFTLASPIFVNWLLVFGSGVALSEQGQQKRYGNREDFQLYCKRTSKFFLWPPKATE